MKSYTDLEQSKKLVEILPPESADMMHGRLMIIPFNDGSLTPCWSLAALLNILPDNENISTNLSKGGYRISTLEYTNSWFVDYEDETNGLNNCVTSADNPVDACYNMIIKLHELNLL